MNAPSPEPEAPQTPPPCPKTERSRRELFLAMAGVAATVVLVAFDSTIVSTSLPRVAQALDGMALYAWAGTGYLLATAASIMIFGRLGDLFGRKPLMLLSVSIVALGSLLCGLAQNMPQLIAFRTVQGIGAGMMIATAFAAPADLFPDARERVRWMAMISATFAVSSGIGPVLGGAVTQALGWRAAFFIAPVAAAVALLLLVRHFPNMKPQHASRPRIDWLGAALLVVGVAAPLAALELAFAPGDRAHPWWGLALAATGVLAWWVLVPLERRVDAPIFPLRILASRESQLLNVAAVATGAIMFILIFYGPLLLQHELGYTPSHAGLLMTPLVVGIPIGSLVNGRLFPRQGEPQRLMVFGSALLAIGSGLMLTVGAGSADLWILLVFLINGVGLGFMLPNLTLFMQMLAARADVGAASALVQMTRAVGSATGTAAVGIAITHASVLTGVRIGLVLCLALGLLCALVTHNIQMKNAMSAVRR
ncbi:Multidrug resistance protein B [plant metagenome]|uniref:Multidrug resistance protein B n=1 Tax=plant metagenome TaxID=1297885 RepID=A0A484RDD8_9ZZZZ